MACERTAAVRDAFRNRGHDAWSCDLEPTEGDPAWHMQDDVRGVLSAMRWDLLVAFPPCSKLSNIGNKYHAGTVARSEAVAFAMLLMHADIPRIAVENPVGHLSTAVRKPDQIIDPWMFGSPYRKRTCLWLRGLPKLKPCRPVIPAAHWVHGGTGQPDVIPRLHTTARTRERTFSGVAEAMADQWGGITTARQCAVCRTWFGCTRSDARTCSALCRKRLSRMRAG